MKTLPRGLPLFRSDGQAVVLAEIYLAPAGISLSQIARRGGLSPATVHHEVERLEGAGLVRSERVGRTRVVRPDESSPVFAELKGLIDKTFGPLTALSEELHEVEGIRVAYIFGSWADRYEGKAGPAPQDVDVVVIGEVRHDDVYAACRRAEDRLRVEINPVVLSEADWDEDGSPFIEELKDASLIQIAGIDR
jgi:DNA-binding transcriptional ArsR family regulator